MVGGGQVALLVIGMNDGTFGACYPKCVTAWDLCSARCAFKRLWQWCDFTGRPVRRKGRRPNLRTGLSGQPLLGGAAHLVVTLPLGW